MESNCNADKAGIAASVFTGTNNPRHLRTIDALMFRNLIGRQELDSVSGSSNSPEMVAELRRRGLEIPCVRIHFIDRDGLPCRPGVYSFTASDRNKLHRWNATKQALTGGVV